MCVCVSAERAFQHAIFILVNLSKSDLIEFNLTADKSETDYVFFFLHFNLSCSLSLSLSSSLPQTTFMMMFLLLLFFYVDYAVAVCLGF